MLPDKFRRQLKEIFHLQPQQCILILAVSGGVDSVVLAHLTASSGYDFIIAHCNFQLRGPESERDEAFVKLLGAKYEKNVQVKKFETKAYAEANKISSQEAARELRYQWFHEIASSKTDDQKSKYVVTAHHANDNIETVLMHLFRGTGLAGLTGIPAIDKKRKIIRPLLFVKREEILEYAGTHRLQWVEDSSNATDKYTRNFFRLRVIPLIKEIYPALEDNLFHNIERFKEAETLYSQSVVLHKKKLLEIKGNEIHIPILKLRQTQPLSTIIWEITRDFGFSTGQVGDVVKLLDADNGSYIASPTHRIIRNRGWIIIAPQQPVMANHILINKEEKKVHFENGALIFEHRQAMNLKPATSNLIATLDAKDITFPLLLRKWKQGDYFYPLGMQKKKKLSRFFIDIKLSKTEKEKVWVIESDKRILWVIGYRIDNRYKITAQTKQILRFSFTPRN